MSLNDPQWGRSHSSEDEKEKKDDKPEETSDRSDKSDTNTPVRPTSSQNDKPQDDLDRLWDEFNRALGGMLGQKNSQQQGRGSFGRQSSSQGQGPFEQNREPQREDQPRGFTPHESSQGEDMRQNFENLRSRMPRQAPAVPPAGPKSLMLGAVLALGVWGATGFYIVPEGQSGIVTTFGKYTETTMPGFRWHVPYPVQGVEIVDVSSVRTTEIGALNRPNRAREALMLTDDENIVDVRFTVQYRIKSGDGAMQYLFRHRDPNTSVTQAAESAMREVVGRKKMDSVLFESKQEIAEDVKNLMQTMLDRYETGIDVMSVNIQNAQPPEPVQAAFNDAVKAGQDRERQINEGEAYANAVIPKARGMAARLTQEAEGYKARVIETAKGDSMRFKQVLSQYQKAPKVTRDRMYIDTMQQIYENTTKVYVDSSKGSNLLYLPFDKLIEQSAKPQTSAHTVAQAASETTPVNADVVDTVDARDLLRNRGR